MSEERKVGGLEKECCHNCKIELETDSNSDIQSGDILISTWVEYCPECLYVNNWDVKISK
jgi:predicted  nucleic acid-binding Zn-ribbon protein